MEKFKTIATFTLPSELAVPKSKLESEGIECQVMDELTVQSYNFISNAVGGVKLQVRESDFDKAFEILKNGGFIKEEEPHLTFLEKKLSDPIRFKKFKISILIFFSIIGLAAIWAIVTSIIQRPSNFERITGERWCLDHILYEDEMYYPKTLSDNNDPKIIFSIICDETMKFDSEGYVEIPGFNSRPFIGKWKLENDKIRIFSMDSLGSFFDGFYGFEMSQHEFTLSSDSIQIICTNYY